MEKVDVVLLTKNSEHLLSKCLSSIYENVPVKSLIAIDGFSTDRTLRILKDFDEKYGNVFVYQTKGSRARARTEGINRVCTDWFVFVDSDVVLCKDWHKKAQADVASGVGAVWGLNVDVIPNVKDRRILGLQSIIARECFNLRGGMHDTLILSKTVKGIKIPEHLHTYEDAFIVQYIEKQGYKASIGTEIYCLHYKPPSSWNLKSAISQAVVDVKCGLVYSHTYAYLFFSPIFALYWGLQMPLNGFRNQLSRQREP